MGMPIGRCQALAAVDRQSPSVTLHVVCPCVAAGGQAVLASEAHGRSCKLTPAQLGRSAGPDRLEWAGLTPPQVAPVDGAGRAR